MKLAFSCTKTNQRGYKQNKPKPVSLMNAEAKNIDMCNIAIYKKSNISWQGRIYSKNVKLF